MSEEKKQEEEPKKITEEEKENMCALEYDIKKKGENAYYYAHKSRFENKDKDPNAKTITGPGIITGGDPVLLHTEQKVVEVKKTPKSISKYQFYDDDKFAVVKIELPEDAQGVTEEGINSDFQKRSFNLTIKTPEGETYIFKVTKLYLAIDPEKSNVKIVKAKSGKKSVKINFAKVEIDEEWTKLTE
jgi:hypothetical protein